MIRLVYTEEFTCEIPGCGYVWRSRKSDSSRVFKYPVRCPKCSSSNWNESFDDANLELTAQHNRDV